MKTLGDLHVRNARLYPDREAVVLGERRLSYAAFLGRVRRLASAVERRGVRRQQRLAVLSTNTIEYLEIYGACEWAGFIAAPFNFRIAGPELEHLLADSQPSLVFFEAGFAPLIEPLRARFETVSAWVCIGGAAPDWAHAYEAFVASGDPAGGRLRAEPQDWAHLFYTSGTTGRPKGVPIRHRGWLDLISRMGGEPEQNLLQVTPLFHVGGRGPTLNAAWAAGKVVLHKGFDAADFLATIDRERINVTFMVAPMIQAVLDHPGFADYDLGSLGWVLSASAPIPEPLLRRAIAQIGPVFYLGYGSTETGSVARMRRSEVGVGGGPEQSRRLRSVGHFEPWIDAKLLDDEGNEVGPGEVGEICVVSPVFEHYWNNSVATIEAMHGPYFRTGDLGRMDERGYVFLVDRRKDMIISGGENIYSREVEDALESHPEVREAAVIGRPDPRWGESVFALVLLQAGSALTAAALGDYLETRIARYKRPKTIAFATHMPRNAAGKIDKTAIRRAYGSA